ncbi:PspC domain-containing protein [Tellurirhabdus rosea]|uniref:PspC domain-containing protein n=1 Tax=Tellurirhabdus rosea TaxID=2674997 RepID=UPI0022594EAE|nr:PspC domain-containing protein [Tellurirhabdus rosea]
MNKRLERLTNDSVLGGVAAGLADYFTIDKTLVRVLFVAGFFLPHFPSLLIYIILWIVLPERIGAAYTVYSSTPGSSSTSTPYSTMNQNVNRKDEHTGSIVFGGLLILIGVYYFMREWFDFYIDFGKIWPIGLILLGVWLLVRNRNRNDDDTYNSGQTPPYTGTTGTSDPYTGSNPQQPL